MNPLILNNPLANPFVPPTPAPAPTFTTGGTLEGHYGAFWLQFEGAFREASTQLQEAGITWMIDMLTPVLIIVTVMFGCMMALGTVSSSAVQKYGFRVLVMLWLTVGGAWMGFVNQMVLEDFPNELAQRIHGTSVAMSAVEQFDNVDQMIKAMAATALGQATHPVYVGERIIIYSVTKFASFVNGVTFYIWCAMRMLLYMTVTMGAFLLIFIPFDGTQTFMRQNFGKIVGLSCWQLGANVMQKVLLTGTMAHLLTLEEQRPESLGNIIDMLGDVAEWNVGVLVLFLLLPAVAGYGSGIVASQTAVQGMMFSGAALAFGAARGGVLGLANATNRTFARLVATTPRTARP